MRMLKKRELKESVSTVLRDINSYTNVSLEAAKFIYEKSRKNNTSKAWKVLAEIFANDINFYVHEVPRIMKETAKEQNLIYTRNLY